MGRRLLSTYTVPPRVSWPPGYPFREGTKTFCGQFAYRSLQLTGKPDWFSRSGAIIARSLCGWGYDQLSDVGIAPEGKPKRTPSKKRQVWLDLDTGRVGDYPVPREEFYPGPKNLLPLDQGKDGPRSQAPRFPTAQTSFPFLPQPRSLPNVQQSSQPPSQQRPDFAGPRQLPLPTVSQPHGSPNVPAPPHVVDLGRIPKVKPGGGLNLPGGNLPVLPGPEGFIPNPLFIAEWIAGFFGQTAIKAQKVAIQDFFTPIFRAYSSSTNIPLRDDHFLQFDPKGVERYVLSNSLYASLRQEFLGQVAPVAGLFSENPGPGLSERIVNGFLANASINGWTEQQTRTLWGGVLSQAKKEGGVS